MDSSKQPQTSGHQDSSDDLIDELARLVAQDARSQTPDRRPHRTEPNFTPASPAPEPRVETARAEPVQPAQPHGAERREPDLDARPQGGDQMPDFEFDFGFGGQQGSAEPEPAPQPDPEPSASGDPIADLIATAEAERFDRDEDTAQSAEAEDDWFAGASADARTSQPSAERDPLTDIEALIGQAASVSDAAESGPLGAGRRVRSSFLGEDEPVENPEAPSAGHQPAFDEEPAPAYYQPASEPHHPTPSEQAILEAKAAGRGSPEPAPQRMEPSFETAPGAVQAAMPDDGAEAAYAADQPFEDAPETGSAEPYGEDEDYAFEDEAADKPRRTRRLGALLIPAALGTVILAGLGGIYFTFFSGTGDPDDVPVLAADGEPLKMDVEPQETTSTASQSVVFNELDGAETDESAEALVSRDQTGGATGDAVSTIFSPGEGESGLANRPVRTVTVRPDGTIVSGEETTAGGNVLPVDRPDVPSVPNSTFTDDPIGEAIAAAMAESGEAPDADAPEAAEAPADSPPATESAMAAVASDAGEPAAQATTTAQAEAQPQQPSGTPTLEQLTGTGQQQLASLDTEAPTSGATVPDTATTATGSVGAWVQLSSQRSEDAARAGIPGLQAQYGSLFNGAEPEVNRVDLGDRGIYYRVRLPQPTMAEANSVCSAIQGQGGDCFVLNN